LDEFLLEGNSEVTGIIQVAIEDFYQDLRRSSSGERIVIGGGFRACRIGERVIGRTTILLKEQTISVALVPIHHSMRRAC
jgi:hypothetical protein